MIDLPYSLVIEATSEPDFFGFYSPELEGFSGIGHSVEDCLYKARWGMKEHVELLQEQHLPVPPVDFPLQDGRERLAGPAPVCPEVHDHRHRGTGLRLERVAVGIDEPRQLRLAFRTARDALADRSDPVARTTRLTPDDCHIPRVERIP